MAVGAPALSEAGAAVAIFSILLTPLTLAGLALIHTGMARSRNAAHLMTSALCVVAVASIVYFVFGFAWQGTPGGAVHLFRAGGKEWNWSASRPLFWGGLELNGSPASLTACWQMLCVALAALIPLGAGAERWRLGAVCASTAVLAGFTYPLFAHWMWGGGWLAQLGVNYGLGRGFVDSGGSAAIQSVGGLTGLSMAWILGPRRGKYTAEGMPMAIPGHNAVFVLVGCLAAWVGWLGLNTAGAILVAGGAPGSAALVAVNTTLAAAGAALVTAAVTRVRFGKPDASLTANGWIAGLAAGSAGCVFLAPAAALLTGFVAGFLVPLAIENLELRLGIDDPGGCISVHALGGLWGVLAAGWLGKFGPGQGLAQCIGVATILGFVLPATYVLNWILDRVMRYRAAPEGERQGLDLSELGAGAYPEFMTHTDEFLQH